MYEIIYQESVIQDLKPIPLNIQKRIADRIKKLLAYNPLKAGKPLRYSLKGFRSLRVGDYRIIYKIDPDIYKVVINTIKHRKDCYEN